MSVNGTSFRNRGFPNPSNEPGSCTLQVKNAYPNVCQIRLDLIAFNVKQPNAGNCDTDRL